MLDIKLIRENPGVVYENLKRRQNEEYLEMFDKLQKEDKRWRELVAEVNSLRQKRNELSIKVAHAKKEKDSVGKLLKEAAKIPAQIKKTEGEMSKHEEQVKYYLMRLPNLLHESVPYGKDENENKVVKIVGRPPKFSFEPKGHLEILQGLGLIDVERAAKVVGHGFFYLKGDLVALDLALQRFALDFLKKKGFEIIEPPFMLNKDSYMGVTDLEFFHDQLYKVENEDLYMIATAEHPMGAMLKDEVVERGDLPIKLAGISPCFRKEVGAHGKYTKGLFRMHHFNKVEQFVFCEPDESWKIFEEIQKNSEELYDKLGLHFRVVNVCTGDIGIIASKKFDIEAWMADGKFREIVSNSNCTDYQARRLNIKFKEGAGKPPIGFVHTSNNTAIATSRTMIAIIEQFQNKDGTVNIPKVLQPFMDGIKKLEKK